MGEEGAVSLKLGDLLLIAAHMGWSEGGVSTGNGGNLRQNGSEFFYSFIEISSPVCV